MPPEPRRAEISDRVRIEHMLRAAEAAVRFMAGRSRADLDADEMLARAVVHAIQEIGEAASRVTEASRSRVPGVPWVQVVGTRHRLVHVYWGINLDLVHAVVVRDLPNLIAAIESATQGWPLPDPDSGA